jgi:hypothetical protein
MSFAAVWSYLQAHLVEGAVIPNWTAAGQQDTGGFTVVAVTGTHVDVAVPTAKTVQHVPARDFEHVHGLWAGYVRGSVPRYQIREVTRYSKYIISMLYWLECERSAAR